MFLYYLYDNAAWEYSHIFIIFCDGSRHPPK